MAENRAFDSVNALAPAGNALAPAQKRELLSRSTCLDNFKSQPYALPVYNLFDSLYAVVVISTTPAKMADGTGNAHSLW